MARKAKAEEKAPKACRECRHWTAMKEKIQVAGLLETAITKMEAKLREDDFKPTIADWLKLVQLQQDLQKEEAREIKVTWVEPTAVSKEK